MASTAHGGLTANTIKSVEIDAGRGGIVVVNRSQEGIIWVRIDGQDPEPEGAGSYAVFGAREFPLSRSRQQGTVTVRMISDSDRTYTVEAY